MSGNGIRCLAWVAARAGLGTADTSRSSTPRPAAAPSRSPATPPARSSPADVDMGAVTLGDEDVEITVDGVEYWGDVANVGNPHLVCFVIDPAAVPVTRARPAHRARRPVPAPHERRVRPRAPARTSSTCGSGSAASGRRCRAAPALARRPRSPTIAASSTNTVRVRVPGGELDGHARRDRPARRSGRARLRRRHRITADVVDQAARRSAPQTS